MAVFRYAGVVRNREDYEESGTVVAETESAAKQKLAPLNLRNVRLKRLTGVSAFLKKLTADIK